MREKFWPWLNTKTLGSDDCDTEVVDDDFVEEDCEVAVELLGWRDLDVESDDV